MLADYHMRTNFSDYSEYPNGRSRKKVNFHRFRNKINIKFGIEFGMKIHTISKYQQEI